MPEKYSHCCNPAYGNEVAMTRNVDLSYLFTTFVSVISNCKNEDVMKRNKTNLMNSPVTCMGVITVMVCILIVYGTQDVESGWLTYVNFGAMIIDITVFVGWLIWASYIMAKQVVLTPLTPRVAKIINNIGSVLLAYWILIRIFPSTIGSWIIPVVLAIWVGALCIVLKDKNNPES